MRAISSFLLIIILSCQNNATDSDNLSDLKYEIILPRVSVSLATSDSLLANSFQWAATQAMAYVHDGSDPVGLWYEAALPQREAFCMRDVAHQATGAHFLGLAAHNKNMLQKFAENISEEKDWCTFWEINRYDLAAPVDYRNDKEFWYNLPANYDILDACYRQYLWTGDTAYLQDSVFNNFYQRSIEDYTARWQLGIDEVMQRNRWINTPTPLDSSDYFHIARGLPSYEEGNLFKMQVGADLLGFQHKALLSWANILELNGDAENAEVQRKKADQLQQYFFSEWKDETAGTFYQAKFTDKGFVTKPSQFLLYTGLANTANGSEKEVARLLNFGKTNIESQSYLPMILFDYDENKAAYDHILDLSKPDKERREYPEVSFSVVEAIISGLAGVEANASTHQVSTLSRLSINDPQIRINNIPIFNGEIDIAHLSPTSSTLRNNTGVPVTWKARFYGQHDKIEVNGNLITAKTGETKGGKIISYIEVAIKNNEEIKISLH